MAFVTFGETVRMDLSGPRMLRYIRECLSAEKFVAMIKLRELNSRMNDFYDLWLMSRQSTFDGGIL